jgi:hypothetical protein
VYYDTPDLKMYTIHHDRHLVRDKVRVRTYVDSQLTFCEVKHKSNKGRTKKKRIEVRPGTDVTKDPEAVSFLTEKQPYPVESLSPNLETAFDRFTLVNFEKTERLTIDSALRFHNIQNGCERDMEDLVIIELKRDGLVFSPVLEMLRQLRIHPHGFSKYCMGSALTCNGQLPVNRFKRKLIEVDKIVNQQKQ